MPNDRGPIGVDVLLGVLLSLPAPVIGFLASLGTLMLGGSLEAANYLVPGVFALFGLGYLGLMIWVFQRRHRPGFVIGLIIGMALHFLLSSACFAML